MKFLVLSDIHGDLAYIEQLKQELAVADGILFGGDFARFNEPETGLPALKKLIAAHESVYAVLGNCDEPDFMEELENADISVQKSCIFRDGLAFAGSGGALKFTGTTPNERTDDDLLSDFDIITRDQPDNWKNLIVIMHQPPKDTCCDIVSAGFHVGSPLLRQFIEQVQPLIVVTGHIHESAGIDHIGRTVVVNPGSLAEGKYAVVELIRENNGWQVGSTLLKEIIPQ